MTFSISEYRTYVEKSGISRQSHYDVLIAPPNGGRFASSRLSDFGLLSDMIFRAESAEKPGRGVQTAEIRYWGPTRRIGYEPQHEPITITFLCSTDLREREFFMEWHDEILGNYRDRNNLGSPTFDVGYYDDYVGQVDVREYDSTGRQTNETTLIEAFPVFVSPLPHSWNAEEVQRVSVTMAYRFFNERTY